MSETVTYCTCSAKLANPLPLFVVTFINELESEGTQENKKTKRKSTMDNCIWIVIRIQ